MEAYDVSFHLLKVYPLYLFFLAGWGCCRYVACGPEFPNQGMNPPWKCEVLTAGLLRKSQGSFCIFSKV